MSYEKTTILSALNRIHNRELVLPDIQRDFVWDSDRILKLLDSIMRNYPFGTMLFWNTKQRLQFREFDKDWHPGKKYTFQIKPDGKKGTIVLDGQQRLQSLYIALYGSFEGNILYFDLLSGKEQDDVSEIRYVFEFLTSVEAENRNQQIEEPGYWVSVKTIADITNPGQLTIRAQEYLQKANIPVQSERGKRLSQNITSLFWKLKSDSILNYYVIDKDFGDDGIQTEIDEILEIFVRVNSGGEVLSKSDLMFSLIQLYWENAQQSIAELLEKLNEKSNLGFDKDFILKTALVCCGKGARYEVKKLRDAETLKAIKTSFPRIEKALISCMDFVVNIARFKSGRVLRSRNSLIPFVYFFFLQPNQMIKCEDTLLAMNHTLYLALMTGGFSRYADSRIDHIVQNILKPANKTYPGTFPIQDIRRYLGEKVGRDHIDDWLLQNNISLLMNILEGGTVLPDGRRYYRPEYDHIFPKSKLEQLGRFNPEQINHFANFRLISKHQNIWKSNQDPDIYFKNNPKAAQRYLVPMEYLDYEHYTEFLSRRRQLIWNHLHQFFGISDDSKEEDTRPTDNAGLLVQGKEIHNLQDAKDKQELIRKVLTRIPVPKGQKLLYNALLKAPLDGIGVRELAIAMGVERSQISGILGALGRRINNTPGIEKFGHPGIGLLLGYKLKRNQWHYWICPEFRALLEKDEYLARIKMDA